MTESITCPVCGRTSYNPNDVREGYCGHCHAWTGTLREQDQRARERELERLSKLPRAEH